MEAGICVVHRMSRVLKMAGLGILALALTGGSAAAEAVGGTLDKIAATKSIAIGIRDDAPPFSYRIGDGTVIGYSIDLCRIIVERLRARLKLDRIDIIEVPSTAATRFVLVKSGAVDLECATTTNNAERREHVAFSYPHFITATRFVSRRQDGLGSIRALKGHSVVSTTGTINVEQLNALNLQEKLNISVLLARRHAEAFAMVEEGRAAAFVMDAILLAALVAAAPRPADYVISQETFGAPEPYGMLMRRDDPAFKDAVNEALRQVFTSGEIDEIYAKWFTSPIPPHGHNLNLPLSAELKAAFADPREYLD